MPSRRQIREAAIQFLYSADLEGGLNPIALRDSFWDFLTETDRKSLHVAVLKMLHHLAHGRMERLHELIERVELASAHLSSLPQALPLKDQLHRLLALESAWSIAFEKLSKFSQVSDELQAMNNFEAMLERFFQIDRDLVFHREQFLRSTADFPSLKVQLEPLSASIRRLQRISDRLRKVERPEDFPEQADLGKLRASKTELVELQSRTDELVDAVLAVKTTIDSKLESIVENYSPERIDPVDRAILRLGTYELLFTEIPSRAVINEAIELAKRFGTSDSGRFVNGLLDQVIKGSR